MVIRAENVDPPSTTDVRGRRVGTIRAENVDLRSTGPGQTTNDVHAARIGRAGDRDTVPVTMAGEPGVGERGVKGGASLAPTPGNASTSRVRSHRG